MKIWKINIFILSVSILLLGLYFVFPKNGLQVGPCKLKFASFEELKTDTVIEKVDVDSVLQTMENTFVMSVSDSLLDSLHYYKKFITESSLRIYLPGDDYCFFDTIFQSFENAKYEGETYRILHYGDSQIEMDRISGVLRNHLQHRFGGSGVGMVPAIQRIPTTSFSQTFSGNFTRYIVYGDSTTHRASHKRYGPMAQFSAVDGSGVLFFSAKEKFPESKFSKVSLLVGHNSNDFSAQLSCDTVINEIKRREQSDEVLSLVWNLKETASHAILKLIGDAEVYALLFDGNGGVAVDNVPLRGCSGTIFTRINEEVLRQSFGKLKVSLIILQFGGNMMPVIKSQKTIDDYMMRLEKQFALFRRVVPEAKMLFIGPSDMSRKENGVYVTWRFLPELNEAIKQTALKNGVAFWNMFETMGGENSMAQWVRHNPPYAVGDHVHFTAQGAKEIGTLLSKSLLTYYDFYCLRKDLPTDFVHEFIFDAQNK